MKKYHFYVIMIILLLMFLSENNVYAGSYYYLKGLGETIYFTQADYLGRGGTAIAIVDRNSINLKNPAGLIFIDITRISGDFYHETVGSKYSDLEATSYYSNLHGAKISIPIAKNKLSIGVGLTPLTRNDFKEESIGILSTGNQYSKQIINKGGLNQFSLGAATSYKKRFFVGVNINYNFGRIEENWKVDFTSDLFKDTSDKIVSALWGWNFTTGIMARIKPDLFIGATYSSSLNLPGIGNYKYSLSKTSDKTDLKMEIPGEWGIGASYILKERIRFSADYSTQAWSNFKFNGSTVSSYNDCFHISTGVEVLPSSKLYVAYYKKMTYQAGFYYSKPGYVDTQGNSISEYLGTFGFGLPYYLGYGRFDIAFGFGKRGDLSKNLVEESIFKFMISISGGEKWFIRPR